MQKSVHDAVSNKPLEKTQRIRFYWTPESSAKLWLREGIWFLGVLLVIGLSRWLTPSPYGVGTHLQLGLPPCSLYLITGRPCPTCGDTTSFAWMARGHILDALHANFLGPFLFTGMVLIGIFSLISLLKKNRLHLEMKSSLRNGLILSSLGIFILYGVIRFLLWKVE